MPPVSRLRLRGQATVGWSLRRAGPSGHGNTKAEELLLSGFLT